MHVPISGAIGRVTRTNKTILPTGVAPEFTEPGSGRLASSSPVKERCSTPVPQDQVTQKRRLHRPARSEQSFD